MADAGDGDIGANIDVAGLGRLDDGAVDGLAPLNAVADGAVEPFALHPRIA